MITKLAKETIKSLIAESSKDKWLRSLASTGRNFGIYNDNKKLIGYYNTRRSISGNRPTLATIYITPEHRGSGFGTKTIKSFLKKYPNMLYMVDKDNKPSRKAAENAGLFTEHKRAKGSKDTLIYEKTATIRRDSKGQLRDYKKEYKTYHSRLDQLKNRAERNKARHTLGLKVGDGKEADHKVPLSKGGSVSKRNLQAISMRANRRKFVS